MAETAYLIAASHDFGKATTFFQNYVNSEGRKYRTEKKNHSSLSAYFCYYLISRQLKDHSKKMGLIGWFTVQRHHGNLTDLSLDPEGGELYRKTLKTHISLLKEQNRDIISNNLDEVKEIYRSLHVEVNLEDFASLIEDESLFKEIKRVYFTEMRNPTLETYYMILVLYSILLDADKLDAAGVTIPKRRTLPRDPVINYKKRKFGAPQSSLNKLREEAASSVKTALAASSLTQRFYSITLPTGMGKTLTGLDAAFTLRERIEQELGFRPRIIYSLPFLSIIEQNYDVLEKVLEETGSAGNSAILLKHHYLSTGYLAEDDTNNAAEGLLLTEGWHSEVVVTTFVQFFESLITHRNSRARKIHNMANSVFILDEVQNIPLKYWETLKEALMVFCERYNSWLILMTATNPLIFDPRTEIMELVDDKERYYSCLDRVKYVFSMNDKTLDQLADEVVNLFQYEPNSDIMVVMNTINSSKQLYWMLKEALKECLNEVELIYLSTHVLPGERMNRIQLIKESPRRKLIVSTQLIEAGVDIDIDIIYRDFAPLDSIIQTAGRCNRESTGEKGRVRVVKLMDENRNRAYSSYIYDSVLLEITENIIGAQSRTTEAEFNLASADRYFRLCRKRALASEEVLKSLERLDFEEASNFHLIENIDTVKLYIERNDEAREIREKVDEVLADVKSYKRRGLFLPFKRRFYKYVLNVRVPVKDRDVLSLLDELDSFKGIYLVKQGHLNSWYDPETGFQLPNDTLDMRMI